MGYEEVDRMDPREIVKALDLNEFCNWLGEGFDLAIPDPSSQLYELDMDSLKAIELLTAIEDLMGGEVAAPIDLLIRCETVRDLHAQYCIMLQTPTKLDNR
jgi:acyl carrier protein